MTNAERIVGAASRAASWLRSGHRDDDAIAMCARLLGALHDLAHVERLGFGAKAIESASTLDDLLDVADALATESDTSGGRWLAGYHFNAAKHRLRTVCEDPLVGLLKPQSPPPDKPNGLLARLSDDDNGYKHSDRDQVHETGYRMPHVTEALDVVDRILGKLGA